MGVIRFNGISSADFGCTIERRPNHTRGSRRGELIEVPGRNGAAVLEDGSFTTYTQEYAMAFKEGDTVPPYKRAAQVAEWLLGSRGFCRLEDDFEPNVYRMARYAGALNIEQVADKYGQVVLEFECQPQRYLKSGESEIMIESNASGSSSIAINNFAKNAKRVKLSVSQDASVEPCVGSLKIYKSDDQSDYISAAMTEIVAPDDFVYTNVMNNSGAQFKAGLRYSKGSAAFVSNNDPACDAVVIPIPSNVSNIRIRVKNATFSAYNTIYGGTNGRTFPTDYGRYQVNPSPLQDENGDVYFDFENSGSAYITFNLAPVSDPSALIVTVNEPIVKINADGIADYEGTLLIATGYDSTIATVTEQGNPSARLVVLDPDGNEINAAAMRSGQAVIVNPTQFEARPLLKFVDTSVEPSPVSQTLTKTYGRAIGNDGTIVPGSPSNYVSNKVDTSGFAYAIVTGIGYSFLDSSDRCLSFYSGAPINETKVIIPQNAVSVIIGGSESHEAELLLQAARPNPGVAAVTINGTTINLDFSEHDTIFLDCDLHDAYYIDGSSANNKVSFANNFDPYPTFPGLLPGENTIIPGDGSNLDFELTPRWWAL
ncbi:MAG: hypothetical protein II410_04845 [Ruminococcus sp.]|nr:hypothetical protein [Ruminococcus sp.]